MNTYKKTLMMLGMALAVVPQICSALDAEGSAIKRSLMDTSEQITRNITTGKKLAGSSDLAEWNNLLNTSVRNYIEKHSKIAGIKDSTIIKLLNGVLNINILLNDNLKMINPTGVRKSIPADSLGQVKTTKQLIDQLTNEVKAQKYSGTLTSRDKAQEMLLIALTELLNIINVIMYS